MFKKYNSIENSYRQEFIDKIIRDKLDQQSFVVQEKAHGANMSFWTQDGKQFNCGKRTSALKWEEKFYNFQYVFEKNKEKLQKLYYEVKAIFAEVKVVQVFGELIGGHYKHPDVTKDQQALKTQKGIFYSPSNEFYAFDIMINQTNYLDVNIGNQLFEKAGLIYAKNLFQGSLDECLTYPNTFESTIYKQLHLPEIKPNIAEGVVIKPVKACFLGGGQRVILKNKNEKWEEVAQMSKRTKKAPADIPEQVKSLQDKILNYVTENRFNNLLSKIGYFEMKDFGKVLGMFSKDIVEDFAKDFDKEMNELDKSEQKHIKKAISKPAAHIIKKYLIEK
jgi:Rnl2 family RNA ligase